MTKDSLYAEILKLRAEGYSKRAIGRTLNLSESTVRSWLKQSELIIGDVPLSEISIPKLTEGSKEDVIEDIRNLALANPEKALSRNYYRVNGTYSESVWSQYFGTWHEAKRQAGVVLTRVKELW